MLSAMDRLGSGLAATVLAVGMIGCATVASLPEVDLADPAWTVTTGQALWRPAADRTALAGELLIARNDGGDVFISFAKPPLPIFTAQTSGKTWRLDFVERGRSYAGRGQPPGRFVWFRLPAILAGEPPPSNWDVKRNGASEWSMTHRRSGEAFTVVLDP